MAPLVWVAVQPDSAFHVSNSQSQRKNLPTMPGGKWNPPIDGAPRLASEEEADVLELDSRIFGGAVGAPTASLSP